MKEKAKSLVHGNCALATLRPVVGLVIVAIAAASLSHWFAGNPASAFVPLGFVLILFGLAMCCGIVVGVAGSLLAALIFAHVLFTPVGNWQVADHAARQNIAWMILGSVVLSYLFVPSRRSHQK